MWTTPLSRNFQALQPAGKTQGWKSHSCDIQSLKAKRRWDALGLLVKHDETQDVEPRRWFFLYKFGSFSTGLWILWFLGRVRLQQDVQKICGTFSQHYRTALPLSLHTLRTLEILVDEPGYGIFSAASLRFALWTTAIWRVSSFGTCRHLGKLDIGSLVYHAMLKV